MRKLSGAAVAIIIGVALYFTVSWGYDGLRVLTSPSYGLDHAWRAQFIFGIGSIFGLSPIGLIKLAAFFGAMKLAVAGFCAIYVFDRMRALIGGRAAPEILEGGLIMVVLVSIVTVGPAVWSHNADMLREATIQLALAAVATALLLVERRPVKMTNPLATTELAATPRGAPWYSPFR